MKIDIEVTRLGYGKVWIDGAEQHEVKSVETISQANEVAQVKITYLPKEVNFVIGGEKK